MDAKQFLAEFGHIVNAPEGVKRLRELILQLAIQGDLSERVLNDIPAEILFESNQNEKRKQISEGTIPRQKPIAKVDRKDHPWDLPDSWKWCRLGEVTTYGVTLKAEYSDVTDETWVLELEDIEKQTSTLVKKIRAKERRFRSSKNRFLANYVLYGKLRPYLDKVVLADEDGVCTTEIMPISVFDGVVPAYLRWYLKSPFFINYANNSTHGMNLPRMGTEAGRFAMFALPPKEEQIRIVAKVDELMALCDKLEAQQQKRRKLQTLTRTTALDALANAQSPHELKDAWLRVQSSFPLLFDGSVDVVDLKQTLRELAIIGHLSERTEEDVENYLRHLSKFKSAKRTAKLKEVESDIVLPKGWRWVLLEDLIHSSDSGWSPKCNPTPREKGEWGVLKVSAVTWGKFKSEENKALPLNLEARPEHEVKPLDFMLSRANTAELVAKSVIAPVDVPEKLMMSDKIIRLNFIDDDLKPWVNLVNNSRISREYYKQNATGTSDSMRNVSRKVIHELAVPLPSKSEQEKILEKLKYLDLYCDRLEKQFTKANKIAKNLAQAAIASITGTEIKEDLKMKAPKTELVSKLKLKVSPNNKDQAPLSAILAKHNGELSSKALWNYSGLEIDAFYQQLKTEMAREWIVEPEKSRMIEKDADNQSEAEAEI